MLDDRITFKMIMLGGQGTQIATRRGGEVVDASAVHQGQFFGAVPCDGGGGVRHQECGSGRGQRG